MKKLKLTYFLSISCAFYACVNSANANTLETHCVINADIQKVNDGNPKDFEYLLIMLGKYNMSDYKDILAKLEYDRSYNGFPNELSSEFSFDFTQNYNNDAQINTQINKGLVENFHINGQRLNWPDNVKFNISDSKASYFGNPDYSQSLISANINVNYVRKTTGLGLFNKGKVDVTDTWVLKGVPDPDDAKKDKRWEIVITRPSDKERDKGQSITTSQTITLKPFCTVNDKEALEWRLKLEKEEAAKAKKAQEAQEEAAKKDAIKAAELAKNKKKQIEQDEAFLKKYQKSEDVARIQSIMSCSFNFNVIKNPKLKPILVDYFGDSRYNEFLSEKKYNLSFGWKKYNPGDTVAVTSISGGHSSLNMRPSFYMDLGQGYISDKKTGHEKPDYIEKYSNNGGNVGGSAFRYENTIFKTKVTSADGVEMLDTWVFNIKEETDYYHYDDDSTEQTAYRHLYAHLNIFRNSADPSKNLPISADIHCDDKAFTYSENSPKQPNPTKGELEQLFNHVNNAAELQNSSKEQPIGPSPSPEEQPIGPASQRNKK